MTLTDSNANAFDAQARSASPDNVSRFVGRIEQLTNGAKRVAFYVPDMVCARCMQKIEQGLGIFNEVENVRANLSAKRVTAIWRGTDEVAALLSDRLSALGFKAEPYVAAKLKSGASDKARDLLTCMAVAGFAAANVMLMSVSVWSGHDGSMEPETRELFHWISALFAIPAVAYAGRPFFRSAAAALRGGQLNMDVPISLAILLATGASLVQTAAGATHVYFDAAVGLLFFLLVGRYLDEFMRARSGSALQDLLALRDITATRIEADGTRSRVSSDELAPGDKIIVAIGERIAADGDVVVGTSEIDSALVTGESAPVLCGVGDAVYSGTTNLSAPLTVEVTKAGDHTLLAEMSRALEIAEHGRSRYTSISDRIARAYAPGVHIISGAALLFWLLAGAHWSVALMIAITVLIITCPCALGLAVPVVHVVASGRLFRGGVLNKSEDALERLAAVDHIVFDKTGTMTSATVDIDNADQLDDAQVSLAARLAQGSRHPFAQAIVGLAEARGLNPEPLEVSETPGAGLAAQDGAAELRLGNSAWAAWAASDGTSRPDRVERTSVLARDGRPMATFHFRETLKDDVAKTIRHLHDLGFETSILSGDKEAAVNDIAERVGIQEWRSEQSPLDKVRVIEGLAKAGRHVLIVGDGLNDAPSLKAAHASLSPASATEISQNAADMVFQGNSLSPVVRALVIARGAQLLVKQNIWLAALYNLIAIPIAVAGFVTPLIAAIAMSSSSIIVTLNSLRLDDRAPAALKVVR